ncbi:unnamed protein product [Caenorhabditis brenneri]
MSDLKRKLSSSLVQMIRKISIAPVQTELTLIEEDTTEKSKEAEATSPSQLPSSSIPKIVLVITIPYFFIFPLFAKNLHDWYSTSLLCLLICYILDLLCIATKFYEFIRILSSLEAASLTAMLLFYAKYICRKYESPLSYCLFSMFFLLVIPAYYRCFLLLKLKPAHRKMFKAIVEEDFYDV